MKMFVLAKQEDGSFKLVAATRDQISDPTTILYDEEGVVIEMSAPVVEPVVEPEVPTDLSGLEGMVQDLVGQVTQLAAGREHDKEELKVAKEALAKGFVMPGVQIGDEAKEISDDVLFFDQRVQGKRFYEKMKATGHEVAPELQEDMNKFFSLFVQAGLKGDPAAAAAMRKYYPATMMQKAVIGDSGNAFPIPDIVMSEILHFAREKSVVLRDATVVDMISEKQSYPVETAQPSVGWGNTTSGSNPTADEANECELSAQELSAYSTAKNMTLADARSDLVSWIAETLAEAAGLEIDNEAFNGDGYASDGVCSGMFSTAGYSVVMASTSTAFSSLTASHLSDMISKLDGLKKEGAKYYMHGSILHYVRDLSDDNNRPIWFPGSMGTAVPPAIWGYPYGEAIKCPSTSAVSTAFVLYGNLKYFYVGRRLDSAALFVDPYGLFTTNRTRFKLYQRWGMKTALANGLVKLVTAAS